MTSARIDGVHLLHEANPVPDPEAVVDPAVRRATLERVLATTVSTRRRRWLPSPVVVRRLAVAAGVTAVALAALLVAGEQRSAPQRFAVLPALADELSGQGRILHVVERTVRLKRDGNPTGRVRVEESWTLLDDAMVSRFRLGTGPAAEQGATDRRGSSDYDPESNTVTIVRHPSDGQAVAVEPPVVRMARDAAAGRIPATAGPIIDDRPTLKIERGNGTWYIAQDAPELVRRDVRLPDGAVQRTDIVTFEVLDSTPANRRLLQIQAPSDARVQTVTPRLRLAPADHPRVGSPLASG
jgi:hypothetical protein